MDAMESRKIRPGVLAGGWYPADPEGLRLSIEAHLVQGEGRAANSHGKISGIVLPHAGHKYSGRTCAAGIRRLRKSPGSTAILLGPSHRAFVRGAVLSSATHFETPLGAVLVNTSITKKLAAAGIPFSDSAHEKEHCLEILLPFFQVAMTSVQIVPVLIGTLSESEHRRLAGQLLPVRDDGTILVASSDFVHYGAEFNYTPDVGADVRAGVRKIDMEAIEIIRSMDARALLEFRKKTGATICGLTPIAVLMDALPKNSRVELVDYSQSADVSGDTDHMVSYAAVAFYDS